MSTSKDADPSISIVIPCYNLGNYVGLAIESALNQVHRAQEIIVIDDCSTDNSQSVIEKYDDITVIKNDTNLGHVQTFNKGIRAVSNDYFVVLSADDTMDSDFIEKHLDVYKLAPTHEIYYCDFEIIGSRAKEFASKNNIEPTDGRYFLKFPEPSVENLANLRTYNFLHGSALCSKEWFDKLEGYRSSELPEDLDFGLRTIEMGGTVCHVPFPLLKYRQHSISQTHSKRLHDEVIEDLTSFNGRLELRIDELEKIQEAHIEELDSFAQQIGFDDLNSYKIQSELNTITYKISTIFLKCLRATLASYKFLKKPLKKFKTR